VEVQLQQLATAAGATEQTCCYAGAAGLTFAVLVCSLYPAHAEEEYDYHGAWEPDYGDDEEYGFHLEEYDVHFAEYGVVDYQVVYHAVDYHVEYHVA
jgi:hypothetical protein